jgi:hypothetical protein
VSEAEITMMFAPVSDNASITVLCPSGQINLTQTCSSGSGTEMSCYIEVANDDSVTLAKTSSKVLASALTDDVVPAFVI